MRRAIGYVWASLMLLMLAEPAICQGAGIGWPEAVGRLARERSIAESCIALLKGHGDPIQIARGEIAYNKPKADFDGVIAGLVTALAQRVTPDSLPNLIAQLERGASGLAEFCQSVDDLVPRTSGQKNVFVDITKAALEALVKPLSEAVSTLYNDYFRTEPLTRQTIQAQLQAARWPEFSKVETRK